MIKLKQLLLEVDWERFSDVQKTCMSAEAVADRLNAELDRLKTPKKDREKADINFPRISKGNIPTDAEGKANVIQFIKDLIQRPKTIFDIGEKSEHSTDENIMTINTGIPALKAVLFDEAAKQFYVINTCPGAGSCIKTCYAMQAFYIFNDGKNIKLARRLQLMMNHPDEYARLAYNECKDFAGDAKKEGKKLMLRWNDAGDIYSKVYFDIIVNVTNKLLKAGYDVESYAYTKVGKYMKLGEESGIIMNFSSGARRSERDVVDLDKSKYSKTVERSIFKGIFIPSGKGYKKDETKKTKFADPVNGRDELKKRIFDAYKNNQDSDIKDLTFESLRYTDELPSSIGEPLQYNIIVLPAGDSDRSAQRRDVKYTFLCEH